jgi:hypothetical protein
MPRVWRLEKLPGNISLSLRAKLASARTAAVAGSLFALALAPANAAVTISDDQTQNINCSGGICAPTAQDAVLNVSDLESMLASGNVEVTTTGSGVQADDIDVASATSWSSASALALDAYRSLSIGAPVLVEAQGGLSLTTNDGGKSGLLSFANGGEVTFQNLSSQLLIDGESYTLVNSIASLAGGIAADPRGAYALANSYDAGNDGTYSESPVHTMFKGTFEGLGNTVTNLTIVSSVGKNIGLFANLHGATVRDTGLTNTFVSTTLGRIENIGGIAGTATDSVIDQVYITGTVSARRQAYLGSLVGHAIGGFIMRSFSAATVSDGNGLSVIGGLVGLSDVGNSIVLSFAVGDVSGGSSTAVGGLVGEAFGTISESYATGSSSGGKSSGVGGLVGDNSGTLSNVYANGSVTSPSIAGGLIGYNNTTAVHTYSIGSVSKGATDAGGSIGFDNSAPGSVAKTYWDTTTSGITNLSQGAGNIPNDPGIKGKTTAQLQSGLPKGFDPKIWAEDSNINGGLPYLIANPPQ